MIYKKIGGFNTRDYAVIALLSGALLVMEIVLSAIGGTLPMIIFVCFVDALFTVLLVLVLRKFGAVILSAFLSATIALPTPAYGIPGLAKYPLLVFAALMMELLVISFQKRERLACMLGGSGVVVGNFIAFYYLALFMGLPSALSGMLPVFVLAGMAIGSIGGYSGYIIYKKIENKPLIRQLGG